MSTRKTSLGVMLLAALSLVACGGSGAGDEGVDPATVSCDGSCANAASFLSVVEVQQIIAQAVAEAQARGVLATIAVVDRVGNVLAVFRMGADPTQPRLVNIRTRADANGDSIVNTGLDGLKLPVDDLAAISKAITGAYLSSEGNAFSTRTASQIVQENFNPGERNQPGGPLFGVQFSQLGCSDFVTRQPLAAVGPRRSPLGLAADPGGFPLYKAGTVVGGVGVSTDPDPDDAAVTDLYSADPDIIDIDAPADNLDEIIALSATFGFAAPPDRRGDQITVEGKVFRFSDAVFADLVSDPATPPPFASLDGVAGGLVAVTDYTDGTVVPGLPFGQPGSGIRADAGLLFPGLDAFIFVDDANTNRYPPVAGSDGVNALTAVEVRTILHEALAVANRARGQIRQPLGSPARVTVSVVDSLGQVLGMARSRDAPVFGADVSLQKARTAAFFSSAGAAAYIAALPDVDYLQGGATVVLGDYVTALQDFLNDPDALVSGQVAFSDRATGNLARPFFPDGLSAPPQPNGPLSKPFAQWSPFSTGLQLDLAHNAIVNHVLYLLGLQAFDTPANCAGGTVGASTAAAGSRLANGAQIFPGSVPVYRDQVLVGGIGISGDGIEQDDMIAFLGLHNASLLLGSGVGNAPPARRADQITVPTATGNVRLRYVQCPQAPFLDSDEQGVCSGK